MWKLVSGHMFLCVCAVLGRVKKLTLVLRIEGERRGSEALLRVRVIS